ncbi:MAG: hypothetical protein V3V18_03495, partial [Methylococcales bacterium]
LNRLDFFAASRRIVALFNEEQRKNTTISRALQRTFFNQTASYTIDAIQDCIIIIGWTTIYMHSTKLLVLQKHISLLLQRYVTNQQQLNNRLIFS